jgi:hypothetical protein
MRLTVFCALILGFSASWSRAQTTGAPVAPGRPTPPLPAPAFQLPTQEVRKVAPKPERFFPMFAPLRTDTAALAPDGKHLAYTWREKDAVSLLVVPIDTPRQSTASGVVARDHTSTPMMEDATAAEDRPAMVQWLGWASPTRVVFATNENTAFHPDEQPDAPGAAGGSSNPAGAAGSASPASGTSSAFDRVRPPAFRSSRRSLWQNFSGKIYAMDFDGKNARPLVSPTDIQHFNRDFSALKAADAETTESPSFADTQRTPSSPTVVGLSLIDPRWLLFTTNHIVRSNILNGETEEISAEVLQAMSQYEESSDWRILSNDLTSYRVDVMTGKQEEVSDKTMATETARRETKNEQRQPLFVAVGQELAPSFPGESVDIRGCDTAAQHFLVLIQSVANPGSFYVYDRPAHKMIEIALRAVSLGVEAMPSVVSFGWRESDGEHISGKIVIPRKALIVPTPLLIWCPRSASFRASFEYRAEALALADMGMAVAILDGSPHLLPRPEPGAGAEAAQRQGIAQAALIRRAVEGLAARFPVNPKHVALFAEHEGAALALRAQEHLSDRIRCTIVLMPEFDYDQWRIGSSPTAATDRPPGPIFVLDTYRNLTNQWNALGSLWRKMGSHAETHYADLDRSRSMLPKAKAEAFGWIESFLNEHLYNFTVHAGEVIEVK